MPNVISTDMHDTWTIDASREEWTLNKTGSISVDGIAIFEDADQIGNRVFIEGDIHSQTTVDGSTAVNSAGHRSQFFIADTSVIRTETGFRFGGDRQHVENAGLIHATGTAVLAEKSSTFLHFKNSGEMTGDVTMVLTGFAGVFNRSAGLITGTDTAIMASDGHNPDNWSRVLNKGTISAPVAIDSGNATLLLDNYGTIKGNIELSSGSLQAEFFGKSIFRGQIEPGEFGANITIHQGATFSSPISGLDGNTHYVLLGNVSATISESKHGGADSVATSLKQYHLPDNVENLFMNSLLTDGQIPNSGHGIGNSLDNMMIGEKNDILEGLGGDDILMSYGPSTTSVCTMIGGAGDDTFVTRIRLGDDWKTSWDVITDFVEGQDKIAFLPFPHVHSIDDLDITQHGKDTWIGHDHKSLILKDFDASTLTSHDFQFDYENPLSSL